MDLDSIYARLATELSVEFGQVKSASRLLNEATVPFIARYRKESTGGLNEIQLRKLEERLAYLRSLEERRAFVLDTIRAQGKLSSELKRAVLQAETRVRLEDLYLPFRPKRKTKAQAAREAGLEPLALKLLGEPSLDLQAAAKPFSEMGGRVASVGAALEGARQILIERFAEDADLVNKLRSYIWKNGCLRSKVINGKEEQGAKFSDYFDYRESLRRIRSHRALALFRGRKEGVLRLRVVPDQEVLERGGKRSGASRPESIVAEHFSVRDLTSRSGDWFREIVHESWKNKILARLQTQIERELSEQAEGEAISVFGENLRDLLLAAPAGTLRIVGLDPGYRTGVKVAVVDGTGKLLETATIFPHQPRCLWNESLDYLVQLVKRQEINIFSIGNGTASRETDRLVCDLISRHPELKVEKVMVSEAGASVYSASNLAIEEFPELDVSLRGAISIARRLQDPLAELVKIEPKSLGVGQYQHDINQVNLARMLDKVVEDCVNAVGVDLNTASLSLLTRVSGLGPALAERIVLFREENGPFRNRKELKRIPGLGPRTFEQCAGFLRIRDGNNPLDASAVHPEAYEVVERIARKTRKQASELIGAREILDNIDPKDFINERFGVPTVVDILSELDRPGRDPRPEFKTARFREGVQEIGDLSAGMILEGVITNVTNFGAFVDVGVHQDGLVHISELSDRFVRDPRELVHAGDLVKVKVLRVDLSRKRIALSIRAVQNG